VYGWGERVRGQLRRQVGKGLGFELVLGLG